MATQEAVVKANLATSRFLAASQVLQGIPRGAKSKLFVVDPANGDPDNHGQSLAFPLDGLEAAKDLCVSGRNDVVLYVAGADSLNLTGATALLWDKSYTHLVGVCAPTRVAQRARIFAPAAYAASPLITVSGSGNIFKNLYIFDGVAHAASLIDVKVTGSRNYFQNVHFAGGGATENAINGGASLNLNGAASENLFEDCTIGLDTVAAATGMDGLLLDGGTATVHGTRNMFKNCLFNMWASNNGAAFVEMMTIYDIDRFLLFQKCLFLNFGTTMATAFVIPAGVDPANKRIILEDCSMIGATDWDKDDRGLLFSNGGTRTGGGNSGILAATAAA